MVPTGARFPLDTHHTADNREKGLHLCPKALRLNMCHASLNQTASFIPHSLYSKNMCTYMTSALLPGSKMYFRVCGGMGFDLSLSVCGCHL